MAMMTKNKTPMQSKAAGKTAPAATKMPAGKSATMTKSSPMAKSAPMTKSAGATSKKPNPNTEFAQDMVKLDDVALVSDILKTEKSLIARYGVALTEVSCEKLRNLIKTHLSECACDQLDTFNYMNQRNLYPTEPAPAGKVTQAKQKYAQKKTQMKK